MSKQQIQKLMDQRTTLVTENRALLDKAESENRALTAEEKAQYDKRFKDVDDLTARIEQMQRQDQIEERMGQPNPTRSGGGINPGQPGADGEYPEPRVLPASWTELTPEKRKEIFGVVAKAEYRSQFAFYLSTGREADLALMRSKEYRDLQATINTQGGYVIQPQDFVAQLIKAVDDAVYLRRISTVRPVRTAESLGVPTLDADPADADWTPEIKKITADTAMAFGKRELHPHQLAKLIKVSNKLLRSSALDVESIVRERLAYKFGVTQEKGFLTGSGAQQPLGVFTASGDGISTGRDVSDGNTTTEVQFDGLKSAKYKLKAAYWPRAQWIFHRDALQQIDKLKDGNGQYQWQPSTIAGQPDRLLNFPFNVSEFAPNTFTSGKYVGVLGDFSFYWIADALLMEVQRLNELYAETNQVGFIGRQEVDGMPVLEEAFVRVKLA